MRRPPLSLAFGIVASIGLSGCAAARPARPPETDGKLAVEDVIPLTAGNMRGHEMLFNEGWYVVSSSAKALEYARKNSIVSSREAIREALRDASRRTAELGRSVPADLADYERTRVDIASATAMRTAAIREASRASAQDEFAYAEDNFKLAAAPFVRGSVSVARRTEEDRRALMSLPGGYFADLKGDFSDLYDKAAAARERFAAKISPAWEESFRRASRDFKAEYDKSGEAPNSLLALGPVLRGYLEAFYHGAAIPAAKTLVRGTAETASLGMFLPAASATIVTGRTVQSTGLAVYYAGRAGTHVIAPTVESGFFGAVALLSAGTAETTEAGGAMIGAVNQVAFAPAAPAVAAGAAAGSALADAGQYVGLVLYDAGAGATQVLIDQGATGVVLGYNALTALPAHALLLGGDAVVLLAWDGPRLLLAEAQGRVRSDQGGKEYSLGELPAGTVVDLKALEKTEGVKVKTLSINPTVLERALENIRLDLRGSDEDR